MFPKSFPGIHKRTAVSAPQSPTRSVPKTYIVCTSDQQLISSRVTEQELFRLRGMTEEGRAPSYGEKSYLFPDGEPQFNQILIRPHRKRKGVWLVAAGVDPALVVAELRRSISRRLPAADVNQTIDRARYATETRAGRFFWHDEQTCTDWHPHAERQVYDGKFSVPKVRIRFNPQKSSVCKITSRIQCPVTPPVRRPQPT